MANGEKLKGFLGKAAKFIPDIIGVGAKIATGNIGGAFEDIVNSLSGNQSPEAVGLLQEFELKREEFQLEAEKIHAADRASARNRETEIVKATGKGDPMMYVLVISGMSLFLMLMVVVFFVTLNDFQEKMAHHVLGLMEGAILIKIFTYYFGSSQGSKDKGNQLDKLIKK